MLLNILKQLFSSSKPQASNAGIDVAAILQDISKMQANGELEGAISSILMLLQHDANNLNYNKQAAHLFRLNADFQRSLQYLEKCLELDSEDANILDEIGNLYQELGLFSDAVTYHQKAVELDPSLAVAYNGLGNAYSALRNFEAAEQAYEHAIKLQADYAVAYNNMGLALTSHGEFEQALPFFEKAIEMDANYALAHNNLANALQGLMKHEQAIEHLKIAHSLEPENAGIINNLGVAYSQASLYSESIQYYEKALAVAPDYGEVYKNIGIALESMGQFDDAAINYKKALASNPPVTSAHTSNLFCSNYNTNLDEQTIFQLHADWGKTAIQPVTDNPGFDYQHDRIRVGYISPDFRAHPVSFFVESIFKHHDKTRFEIFVYHDHLLSDKVTRSLKNDVERWRDVVMLTDEELVNQICKDEIEILVDLAGHTASSRLPMFAQRVAPVQINYLGYPNTTGLTTMDYRITDEQADPIGLTEKFHTEKLCRLENGFLCYNPPAESPEIQEPPSASTGTITFGCFNNAKKINASVINAWSSILGAVPNSKILLKSQHYKDKQVRDNFLSMFNKNQVDTDRIIFNSWSDSFFSHLDLYNQVDVGLDPFPYNGTTTTCEALWMGVPVIARKGNVHRSRVGFSILSQLQLAEVLCCSDTETYVSTAITLAKNTQKLTNYRKTLRRTMSESTLTDGAKFTNNLEKLYASLL